MTPGRRNLMAIAEEVLDERARAVSFSAAEIDAEAARLRAGFARIRATAAERQRLAAQLDRLAPARRDGWAGGVQAAVKIVLGEARRSSRILVDAAQDLLPRQADGWTFAPAGTVATRGPGDAMRAESRGEHGELRTIMVDDAAAERRIVAIIRNFPAEAAVPVLLVAAETAEAGSPIEIDPEILGPDSEGRRTLRYEAVLPPGSYVAAFGNPRKGRQ